MQLNAAKCCKKGSYFFETDVQCAQTKSQQSQENERSNSTSRAMPESRTLSNSFIVLKKSNLKSATKKTGLANEIVSKINENARRESRSGSAFEGRVPQQTAKVDHHPLTSLQKIKK